MSAALSILGQHKRVVLIDTVLVMALYLIPTLSHLTALPLYLLEPMRVVLIAALLWTNRANTYLLAITLPLLSTWMTGHPPPVKAVLMGAEFTILVTLYTHLVGKRGLSPVLALIVGILLGKVVYYSMKWMSLTAGWLDGSLVSTPVHLQLLLALGTAVIFGLVERQLPAAKDL